MALQPAADTEIATSAGATTAPAGWGNGTRGKHLGESREKQVSQVDVCFSQDCFWEAVFSSEQGLK